MSVSRRTFLVGGATAAASAAIGATTGAAAAHAETSNLAVSFGMCTITPASGNILAGYAAGEYNGVWDPPRRAAGTYRSLWARCTVFWDDGCPNVIVTADVLGFGRTSHQAIRRRVQGLGVQSSDFILCATHTHNGPAMNDRLDPYIAYNASSADYTAIRQVDDAICGKIVSLVQNTLVGERHPCTLDYQVTTQSFAVNRAGMGYLERDVPIITARDMSGTPLVVLFSYGCHPVAAGLLERGDPNYPGLYDPDYPGEAASIIEDLGPGNPMAQFILGPAGDQDPPGGRGWSLRNALGQSLGYAVNSAIASPGRPIGAPFMTAYREISLPLDITLNSANMNTVAAYYEQRANKHPLPYGRRHARAKSAEARAYANGTGAAPATTVMLPLQVWKLSGGPGLRLALTGGELVSGYGAYFRTRYGGSNELLIGGYANEVPCYIPSDQHLALMTYESGIWPDFPGLAGASMAVYDWLGHLRGAPDGVEQRVISNLTSMLG